MYILPLETFFCRVAQSVERPSKVPVWRNSTDVSSIPSRDIGTIVDEKIPSHAVCVRQLRN